MTWCGVIFVLVIHLANARVLTTKIKNPILGKPITLAYLTIFVKSKYQKYILHIIITMISISKGGKLILAFFKNERGSPMPNKTTSLQLRQLDDWHAHLRRGDILKAVLPYTALDFSRALVMPNTRPKAIRSADDVSDYYGEIKDAATQSGFHGFRPLMTVEITESTTPDMIESAKKAGAVAGKIYPANQTTNSEDGVTETGYKKLYPVFEVMAQVGMILSLHGEVPNFNLSGLKREEGFLYILWEIARKFPRLRIILEHITTQIAIDCVEGLDENVAATITAHHLLISIDDVIGYSQKSGGKMQPHFFCKPVPKTEGDRKALVRAVTRGNPKFFFGSDSAPHLQSQKECGDVCAGVFSAPVAIACLLEIFAEANSLFKLENFTSVFGAEFYGLPLNSNVVEYVFAPNISVSVPKEILVSSRDIIVPFLAGQKLCWQKVS